VREEEIVEKEPGFFYFEAPKPRNMTERSVVFTLITHKGESRISVAFGFDGGWNKRIREVPGSLWSRTLKCWHIPDTPENRMICGLSTVTGEKSPLQNKRIIGKHKEGSTAIADHNRKELERYFELQELKS